jgi:hypothetical protein
LKFHKKWDEPKLESPYFLFNKKIGLNVVLQVFRFIYKNNTTGATSGARTSNPSGAPEFTCNEIETLSRNVIAY